MNRPGKIRQITPANRRAAMSGRASKQSGFTITELMVVITIMAVLSAILLPALNKGRTRSQAISCLNNLRQLQLAWQMFPDDHDGFLPANNYVNAMKTGKITGDFGPSWCPGDTRTDLNPDNIRAGELFSYSRSEAIYHCPSDSSKVEGLTVQDTLRTRSYSMSGSIGCTVSGFPSYLKFNEVANHGPSRLFVFIDAHEDGVVDGQFSLDPDPNVKFWADMPADRHDLAGNLSFADGHIERWRWATPAAQSRCFQFRQWRQEIRPEERQDVQRLQSVMRSR